MDKANKPDLSAIKLASKNIAKLLKKNDIVVFESTVYPGVTEEIGGAILEKGSGLVCGKEFFLGYSPERINPGDKMHSVKQIPKVVAGQTKDVIKTISKIYGSINNYQIFKAKNIKVAEAAKVIENAQRDINIAFINEITMIFSKMGIKTSDVIETARTKWNFLEFHPGLVGGHCIGVDPFYIAHVARDVGYNPEVILAGRKINDTFPVFLAEQIGNALNDQVSARILILGLTFKENVPDLRNSKVFKLVKILKEKGHIVDVHDPLADRKEAWNEYSIELKQGLKAKQHYDCIIGAVSHTFYTNLKKTDFSRLLRPRGLLADLKGIWRKLDLGKTYKRWEL